jgi:hypothetical protein
MYQGIWDTKHGLHLIQLPHRQTRRLDLHRQFTSPSRKMPGLASRTGLRVASKRKLYQRPHIGYIHANSHDARKTKTTPSGTDPLASCISWSQPMKKFAAGSRCGRVGEERWAAVWGLQNWLHALYETTGVNALITDSHTDSSSVSSIRCSRDERAVRNSSLRFATYTETPALSLRPGCWCGAASSHSFRR